MRSDTERLHDILDAIDQIRKHSSKGRGTFERDELIQCGSCTTSRDWVRP